MPVIALDTNILVYAEPEPQTAKGALSRDLIARAALAGGVIPVQVLGEFLRVVQRLRAESFSEAMVQATLYRGLFITPPTDGDILAAAASKAGASVLLSEDYQDGRRLAGVRIINPFNAGAATLEALLPPIERP